MEFAIYAPADELMRHAQTLEVLASSYSVRGVIIRSADLQAFEKVQSIGLPAWMLAPGLWGNVAIAQGEGAIFPTVPGWEAGQALDYEGRWPMLCPTDPELPAQLAGRYAATYRELGADGLYGTHLRFHHPANIRHLWGCLCARCQEHMHGYGLSVGELWLFWTRLQQNLQAIPIRAWSAQVPGHKPEQASGQGAGAFHPLVDWWAAMTEMDFPIRWFQWKNELMKMFLQQLREQFAAQIPNRPYVINSFEPILAPLTGHHPDALCDSDWYSPLLGYWPTHLWQSLANLGLWHSRLAHSNDFSAALAAIEDIVGLAGEISPVRTLSRELAQGKRIASELDRPYWPVLNGVSHALVPLPAAIRLAEDAGADGIVLQGISQWVGDFALDDWF